MTSTSPCKTIRFQDYCRSESTAIYRCAQPAGRHTLIQQRYAGKISSGHDLEVETNLDCRLRAFENIARHRYLSIIDSLACAKLPKRLGQTLDQSVLPSLHRIGFEKPLSSALFGIAVSSWKTMGATNGKILAFHPRIVREIEDVRQGLLREDRHDGSTHCRLAKVSPKFIAGSIRNSVAPESIFDLLNEIAIFGIDYTSFPRPRTFTLGLNVQF